MKDLVLSLVKFALGMNLDDLLVIRSKEQLEGALKRDRCSIRLLWIDIPEPASALKDGKGNLEPSTRVVGGEALLAFWQLWNKGILDSEAKVIFTDIDISTPSWSDLDVYESCRFGSIFLLNYDSTTSPGAKPSQRGMLMQ